MSSTKNPPKNQTTYRDSGTGQFVPKDYANSHPKTTERERYHNPAFPNPPKSK